MARLSIAAAGNAAENINLINARFQAEALRRIRGADCGVLDNSFYTSLDATGSSRTSNTNFMWKLTATNAQTIVVGRGMATVYGHDVQSERDISFTATAPSAGTKYIFVYIDCDFSNPVEVVSELLIHDNGNSPSWTPPYQDNIITNPVGKYQLPLYRIALDTSGIVTGTQDWTALGVKTIGNPLRSDYATRANDSDRADYPSGDASGKTIKQQLDAITRRLDALGFRTGSVTLPNGNATINRVDRQGNYVILNLKIDYPDNGDTNGVKRSEGDSKYATWKFTVPQNFRPKTAMSISCVAYGYFYDGAGSGGVSSFIPTCTLGTDGVLSLTTSGYTGSSDWPPAVLKRLQLNLGYEAPAIAV